MKKQSSLLSFVTHFYEGNHVHVRVLGDPPHFLIYIKFYVNFSHTIIFKSTNIFMHELKTKNTTLLPSRIHRFVFCFVYEHEFRVILRGREIIMVLQI
jgi:hypothetical protein